jgi:uncharacterized protein YunC (DUF1805 family)
VIKMEPIQLGGGVAIGVMVELPQTRQLTISTDKGCIAAGYMDLPFLQQRRPERHIIAARVLDVREITDLLAALLAQWSETQERPVHTKDLGPDRTPPTPRQVVRGFR